MSVALARGTVPGSDECGTGKGHSSGDTSVFDALYGSAPPPFRPLCPASGMDAVSKAKLKVISALCRTQRAEEKAAKKEMVYQAGKLQLQKKLEAVKLAQRQLAKAELAYENAQEKVFDAQVRLTKRLLLGNDSAPDDC